MARKRKQKKRRGHSIVFKVVLTIVLIFVITMAMLLCMGMSYINTAIIPNADLQLADYSLNLTTTMYYKNPDTGEYQQMQTLYGKENRVWVTTEEIPQNLRDAAVAIEDKRFYTHNGVDWKRTAKGVINMFTGQTIQGGSTITQQLIKNLTDDDEVTVKRKIMEIFRALQFEKNYSKSDILEWYLNYIYLGEGCNGVYTASYTYFGKHVSQLDLAECASLIGITNNPSKYDPYSRLSVTDPETGEVKTARDFNKERQELILRTMCDEGYITAAERDAAIAEQLNFERVDENGENIEKAANVYSWYVDAVIDDVTHDLQEAYGMSAELAMDKVFSGGLEIYTCMNPAVQGVVDEVYQNTSNLNFTSASGQPMQSAITIVDNETGAVVAMSGGVGQKTSSRTFNRATRSLRPPGSSIKPLSVYAPAIELGYITPCSTEVDSPYEDGWPVNATGSYQGTVSIAEAVKNSINTVAVKVLANYVTPEESYRFLAENFHIKLVESRAVGDTNFTDIALAPLALGGLTDGVSTYEMAAAYSVFPRMGTYLEPRTYSLVLDSEGNVLLDNTAAENQALSERTCFYMTNMMEQVVLSGTGTRANFMGQDIAGKTGTTTSRKDLWFVGYTPYYTAAVWTGFDQQERMDNWLGNPSTGMWNLVMSKVHATLPYKSFTTPDDQNIQKVSICTGSGLLASSGCGGHIVSMPLYAEDVPGSYCYSHRVTYNPGSSGGSGSTGGAGGTATDAGTADTGGGTDVGGGDAGGGDAAAE